MLIFYLSLLETDEEKAKAERIYRRYIKLMKYIAWQILEQEAQAEDAAHDAMLRLIENLDCIKKEDSREERAFVAIITRNAALDLLRKEKYREAENIEGYLHQLQSQNCVVQKAYVDELLERIGQLPDSLRDPLEMSIYMGLNSREIAKVLNLKESAVRKRIQRARAYLNEDREGSL